MKEDMLRTGNCSPGKCLPCNSRRVTFSVSVPRHALHRPGILFQSTGPAKVGCEVAAGVIPDLASQNVLVPNQHPLFGCSMNSGAIAHLYGLQDLALKSSTNGEVCGVYPFYPLPGGFAHMIFIFPYIGNFIIPTDELIFFRGVGQPPTSTWRLQGFGHKVMLVEASFAG